MTLCGGACSRAASPPPQLLPLPARRLRQRSSGSRKSPKKSTPFLRPPAPSAAQRQPAAPPPWTIPAQSPRLSPARFEDVVLLFSFSLPCPRMSPGSPASHRLFPCPGRDSRDWRGRRLFPCPPGGRHQEQTQDAAPVPCTPVHDNAEFSARVPSRIKKILFL